jgi:AraC family transcriptional regulator of arabinose operon
MSDLVTIKNEIYQAGYTPKSGIHLVYAGYVVYKPNGSVLRHTHGHYEICLFTQGIAEVTVGDQVHTVWPGDLLITKPGDLHSIDSLGCQWGKLYIGVGTLPDEMDNVFRRCNGNVFPDAQPLEELFRCIIAEKKDRKFGMAVAVEGILMQLMVAAARIIKPKGKSAEKPLPKPVALARLCIEGNPYHDLSLTHVAKFSCLSKSRLSCVFAKETGMSMGEYLRYVIMQTALRLLEDDRRSISSIAEELRYPSQQYFSTVFHKFWGYTPSEYRRALSKEIPYRYRAEKELQQAL